MRQPAIARLAHRSHERDLAEERHAQLARHRRAAAVPEEIGPRPAAGADVVAHVLDHPEHRYLHLAEHLESPAYVERAPRPAAS